MSPDPDTFAWGEDLFNHGYYWEAHETSEGLWQEAERRSSGLGLLEGLILVAAAGVKIREGKHKAAVRHGARAASIFRRLMTVQSFDFAPALGMSLAAVLTKWKQPWERQPL